MLKKIKKNKYFTLVIVLMLILIVTSFVQFYKENFSYARTYYEIKEYCYDKKNVSHEYCKVFKTEEQLNKYIDSSNPEKKYKQYDTITLTCTIVENTIFSCLQYFSPLLIALAVIGTIHSEFSSGMFENFIIQMKYKKYLKKIYKKVLKVALIMPISLIIIFVISAFVTKFNFDISNVDTSLSVYSEWKYNNFILYGLMVLMIQFFIILVYSNISLYCCKKNKNKLVAIIMSYIMFIVFDIIIYIVVYAIILNKLLGFKNMTDYFNIAGYWFFDSNCIVVILISLFLHLFTFAILYHSYKNKEKVILEYEKQIS